MQIRESLDTHVRVLSNFPCGRGYHVHLSHLRSGNNTIQVIEISFLLSTVNIQVCSFEHFD